MPPPAVKTVGDLIYWQYAKIISDSAGLGKRNWRFIMDRFKKLRHGDIFWNEIREYLKEHEEWNACILCGTREHLTVDHMFPRSLGGPQDEKNVIRVCARCNSQKGSRRLYEWFTMTRGLRAAKYQVPRIAEGKYLKMAYEVLREHGMLGVRAEELPREICPRCDLADLCESSGSRERLSPLCLDGILALCLKGEQ